MANRAGLKEASERLRRVMEEVMELDPSGATVMRTAYSVMYPEHQPLPVVVLPSTLATGAVGFRAALPSASPSSGSSSIGKPAIEPIATKPAVKTTKAKPATEPAKSAAKPALKKTKAQLANKQKADAPSSMKHDSESDSDSFGQFVGLLEPDIAKNIADARAIPSTPTPKTKKRKAEKKAPVEGGSEKKKRKVEVEYDPFKEIDMIAMDPNYPVGKQSLTQVASLTPLQLPITPVKGRKK